MSDETVEVNVNDLMKLAALAGVELLPEEEAVASERRPGWRVVSEMSPEECSSPHTVMMPEGLTLEQVHRAWKEADDE